MYYCVTFLLGYCCAIIILSISIVLSSQGAVYAVQTLMN